MMPLNSRPIVQPLQRQVNILISLEFHDGQPPLNRSGQNIDHGAVRGGEGWHLQIETGRVQTLVHDAHSPTTSDSSQRSGCSLHNACWRDPYGCLMSRRQFTKSLNAPSLHASSTRSSAPTPNTTSCTLRNDPGSAPM